MKSNFLKIYWPFKLFFVFLKKIIFINMMLKLSKYQYYLTIISYLIVDEDSGIYGLLTLQISKPVISMLKKNNLHLDYILITHHHHDHIGANLELKKYNCQIIGNEKDKDRIPE